MFKNLNKNWKKVLIPEVVAVFATLTTFFSCRWLGLNDDTATGIIVVYILIAGPLSLVMGFANNLESAFVFFYALIVAEIVILLPGANVFAGVGGVVVSLYIVGAGVFKVAEEFKLPRFWIWISYVTEAVVICLPIYFTVS